MENSPARILVVGGSGGLGSCVVHQLAERFPDASISATYFRSPPASEPAGINWHALDLRSNEAIADLAGHFSQVDWLINCAGMLHTPTQRPEKTIRQFDAGFLLDNIAINTLPALALAHAFHAALARSGQPLFACISARVGSITDNRLGGWYSYRVSKAALNMALRTLSIEWQRTHPNGCVAALHPGTNDTPLSRPFQRHVPPGQLFEPDETAGQLVRLLDGFGPEHSGRFWTWDGRELPW